MLLSSLSPSSSPSPSSSSSPSPSSPSLSSGIKREDLVISGSKRVRIDLPTRASNGDKIVEVTVIGCGKFADIVNELAYHYSAIMQQDEDVESLSLLEFNEKIKKLYDEYARLTQAEILASTETRKMINQFNSTVGELTAQNTLMTDEITHLKSLINQECLINPRFNKTVEDANRIFRSTQQPDTVNLKAEESKS